MGPFSLMKLPISEKEYKLIEPLLNGPKMALEEYNQGENPPLSEDDKKKIREHTAKIHGNGLPKCAKCGYPVSVPSGSCGVCINCGSEIGGCGV